METGKRNERPELAKAMHHAKVTGATLVVGKLDRLSRNAAFLLSLRDSGVKFVCADMPEANNLTIGILAVVAEAEREAISTRTKEALAAAKARGTKLGNNHLEALQRAGAGRPGWTKGADANRQAADAFAKDVRVVIDDIVAGGITSQSGIARALNERGIATARGRGWNHVRVARILARSDP